MSALGRNTRECSARLALQPCGFSTAPWCWRRGPSEFRLSCLRCGKSPHRWKSRRAGTRALRYSRIPHHPATPSSVEEGSYFHVRDVVFRLGGERSGCQMPRTLHRKGPRYACFSPEVEPKARRFLNLSGIIILTCVRLQATVDPVKIRNFTHKGLKRLYEEDSSKGVSPETLDKLRKMLAFLDDMQEGIAFAPELESAHAERRPQGYLEPHRHPQPAFDVLHRQRGARNLRREFRRLSLVLCNINYFHKCGDSDMLWSCVQDVPRSPWF